MISFLLACAGEPTPPPVDLSQREPVKVVEMPEPLPPKVDEPAPLPNIVITAPAVGHAVTPGPLMVSGTAIAWEARLTVQLSQGDEVLDSQGVSASAAAPARGDWSVDLTVPEERSGRFKVRAFTHSAKDGTMQDVVVVDLVGR
ncbi:MAG: hypothetical protein GY913_00665 [Proteobacteria bacterium]|nr:hypothetical protein [Pseudomonadota bacterium]MCP4915409.1 hypothetical protein [Pseudomonadota bacterium]